MIKRILVLLFLAVGLIWAQLANVVCPLDNLMCLFTGQTRFLNGLMFQEYRCTRGHSYWVRQ